MRPVNLYRIRSYVGNVENDYNARALLSDLEGNGGPMAQKPHPDGTPIGDPWDEFGIFSYMHGISTETLWGTPGADKFGCELF